MQKITIGLEQLISEDFSLLKNMRVGLLANHASVDSNYNHIYTCLVKHCSLCCIFAPEHGWTGEMQDMQKVNSAEDRDTNIKIISLYGSTQESLYPKREDFQNIDVLVVDLPDIGSRYYTFAQTMLYCMQVAAKIGAKVFILDRPNPISGAVFEGALLKADCRSFCGYAPVANRHGLTLGELALLMNKGFSISGEEIPPINCDIEVIRVKNWERRLYLDETSAPWVFPSPNMPTLETAIVYPGACLLEGTNLSEGRGTTKPFELFGAPFVNAEKLIKEVHSLKLNLKGAVLRSTSFRPCFNKWANTVCNGIQIHITNRLEFQPFRWYVALIYCCAKLFSEHFSWRKEAYEFISAVSPIDLLFGNDKFRKCIEGIVSLEELMQEIAFFELNYSRKINEFFIY